MERLQEKVKELRRKRGWAQEDLAREIGVSLSKCSAGRQKGQSLLALPAGNLRDFCKQPGLTTEIVRGCYVVLWDNVRGIEKC